MHLNAFEHISDCSVAQQETQKLELGARHYRLKIFWNNAHVCIPTDFKVNCLLYVVFLCLRGPGREDATKRASAQRLACSVGRRRKYDVILTAPPSPGSLGGSRMQQKVGRRVWHGGVSVERVGQTEVAGMSRREMPASSPRAAGTWVQALNASGWADCALQFGRPIPAEPRKQFMTRSAASAPIQIVYVAPFSSLIPCWSGNPCKLFWASLDDSGRGLPAGIVYVVRLASATLVGPVASPQSALTHPSGALVRLRRPALVNFPA